MRAIQFHRYGAADVLQVVQVPVPQPAPGQVRVRVLATAVQPADVIARAGGFAAVLPPLRQDGAYRTGWDFYGVLDALGETLVEAPAEPGEDDVVGGEPGAGAAVIGMTDWLRDRNGTHADYVVLDRDAVVSAPAGLSPQQAAALPVTASTAVQALELLPADATTVAVVGAAGNVGGFALELATRAGLTVLGVAAHRDEPFVTDRGGVFVDRDDDVRGVVAALRAQAPGGVDAVFDTASLGRAVLPAVRDGGTYIGVIAPYAPPPERGIRVTTVGVHTDRATLRRVAALAEAGHLTARVADVLPLEAAADAHRQIEKGGRRGAVVLSTSSARA